MADVECQDRRASSWPAAKHGSSAATCGLNFCVLRLRGAIVFIAGVVSIASGAPTKVILMG